MKVSVDLDRCFGSATCLGVAPEVFALRQDNKAVVLTDEVKGNAEAIDEAIALCPAEAISLTADDNQPR